MVKALIITLLGIPMIAIFWPAGLAMIIWGIATLVKEASKVAKQHQEDVHTIAEHIRKTEEEGK